MSQWTEIMNKTEIKIVKKIDNITYKAICPFRKKMNLTEIFVGSETCRSCASFMLHNFDENYVICSFTSKKVRNYE